jgi:hypothetical protein
MRRRVTVVVLAVCVCVCLSVTTKSAAYLISKSKTKFYRVFLWCFQGFCRVALAENASFKSSGVICCPPPPFSLPGELSMDNGDSNDFFSTRGVCMVSHRSNKTTGSSLIVAHWQISFLAIKLLTWHYCILYTCSSLYLSIYI